MKFLLDENVPISIKKVIISLGHDVTTLKDENQLGINNGDVAKLSIDKKAIIITLDSDFLFMKKKLQEKCKIIYIKIHPRDPKIVSQIIIKYLKDALKKLEVPGKVVISENNMTFESP